MRYIFLHVLIFGIISLLIAFTKQASLYSEDDPLWELDSDTYENYLFGKKKAWIVEFYNNWCGHCAHFAPVWKKFARDVQGWRDVIDVAVVNCNDEKNTPLCRAQGVSKVPCIKLFWHTVNKSDTGEEMTRNRTIPVIEEAMIDFLESHWEKGVPKSWPVLDAVQTKDLKNVFDDVPKDKDSIILFVEHPDSYTGRKVILDLSAEKMYTVKRLLTTSPLFNKLNSIKPDNSIPALLELHRNSKDELLMSFSKNVNDTDIRDEIYERLLGKSRRNSTIVDHTEIPISTIKPVEKGVVYIADLQNAVHRSLQQEVGVSNEITGEKFSALKAYLDILKSYFPGPPHMMKYLSKLYSWLSYKKSSTSGEEFVRKMKDMETENEYLPKEGAYVGCLGSQPKYRGYPCSLWTLFHTLTVQADNANNGSRSDAKNSGGEVLFKIRDYIKYFFTCRECSDNFMEMAENMEQEVNSAAGAIHWLWEHHNQVNRRLSGDDSEDPVFPKRQFPTKVECVKCYKVEGHNQPRWNRDEVMKYLRHFYSKENIKGTAQESDRSYIVDGHATLSMNNLKSVMLHAF